MSKISKRPTRKISKAHKEFVKNKHKAITKRIQEDNIHIEHRTAASNVIFKAKTIEKEQALQEKLITAQIRH